MQLALESPNKFKAGAGDFGKQEMLVVLWQIRQSMQLTAAAACRLASRSASVGGAAEGLHICLKLIQVFWCCLSI